MSQKSKNRKVTLAILSKPDQGSAWVSVNGNETTFANVDRLKAEYVEWGYEVKVEDISAKAG